MAVFFGVFCPVFNLLRASPGLRLAPFQVFPERRTQPLGPAGLWRGFRGVFEGLFVGHRGGHDACAGVPLMARITPLRADFFGFPDSCSCCRSSVVEHSIGNGEVDSSILSGSTTYLNNINILYVFQISKVFGTPVLQSYYGG